MRFTKMTEIQPKAILRLFDESNLVSSAKTGAAKTLAFLIPSKNIPIFQFPSFNGYSFISSNFNTHFWILIQDKNLLRPIYHKIIFQIFEIFSKNWQNIFVEYIKNINFFISENNSHNIFKLIFQNNEVISTIFLLWEFFFLQY